MKFIETATKLKRLYLYSIAFSIIWLLFLILYAVFYTMQTTSTIYGGSYSSDYQNIASSASVFGIIFGITVIIELILIIVCIVKSITLENKNDTNVLVSSDFSTLKILAIISIFFGGFILNIIIYFVIKGLIEKAKNGTGTTIANDTIYPNNNGNDQNNSSTNKENKEDKISKLSQAAELYKQGLITEEEYKKIKDETLV